MKRFVDIFQLFIMFLFEFILANLSVVRMIIFTNPSRIKSGVLDYKVDSLTRRQRLLLSQLITLTPGTLVCDWDQEQQLIRIHVLDNQNPKATLKRIKERIEKPVVKAFP